MPDREYISYPEPILSVTFLVRSGRFRVTAANAGGTTSVTVTHVSSIPCRRLSLMGRSAIFKKVETIHR